jgi:hypothetical protein
MRLQPAPKGYDGDSEELKLTSDVAVHILAGLKSLEANHPYLRADYPEYAALRAEIEKARINPPEDQTVLGVLYDNIRECLHHISDERNAQVTAIGQARRLIPRNYLPISFDLLLEDFRESDMAENVRQGTADIVEVSILGEIDVETISFTHRNRTKAKIMKALVYDHGRAGEIRRELSELKERKVFRLLKLNDVQLQNVRRGLGVEPLPAKNPELPEPVMAAVSLVILRTRAQIIHEQVVPRMPPVAAAHAEDAEEDDVTAIA